MPLFVNQPVDDDDYSCVKLHCSALVPRVLPLWIITLRQRPSFSEGLCYSDIVTVKRLTAAGNWGFFFFVVYVVFSVLKFLQIIFLTFAFASLTNFSQSNKSSWSYIQVVFFFPKVRWSSTGDCVPYWFWEQLHFWYQNNPKVSRFWWSA